MNRLFFISIAGVLYACSTDALEKGKIIPDLNPSNIISSNAGSSILKEDLTEDDCARNEPAALLDIHYFPKKTFEINDRNEGIEEVDLRTGDHLRIFQTGCDDQIINFQFTTKRFKGNPSDLKYWSGITIKLLEQIKNHSTVPFQWDKGLAVFKMYYEKNEEAIIGEQIDFSETETKSYVQLNQIEKLEDNSYVIEVIFSTGPPDYLL